MSELYKAGVALLALAALVLGAFFYGCHVTETAMKLEAAETAVDTWAKTFTLNAQLATRDAQLAAEHDKFMAANQARVKETRRKFEDEIRKPDVAKCLDSSGLLQHYNATNGIK